MRSFPLVTLAIDTCEARGSIALLQGGRTCASRRHADATDYSIWLLPAVEEVLDEAGTNMERVDLLAACTGPGSFTGLRVGLSTIKAWAEVYGKPIVGVSRLEALAMSSRTPGGFVAACYDAQRSQLFGALYRSLPVGFAPIGDESVIAPEEFVQFVDGQARGERVSWITLDPELIQNLERFQARIALGDSITVCEPDLASLIASLAEQRAREGKFSDVLTLDANYVRRSDAEIFWKGPAANVP